MKKTYLTGLIIGLLIIGKFGIAQASYVRAVVSGTISIIWDEEKVLHEAMIYDGDTFSAAIDFDTTQTPDSTYGDSFATYSNASVSLAIDNTTLMFSDSNAELSISDDYGSIGNEYDEFGQYSCNMARLNGTDWKEITFGLLLRDNDHNTWSDYNLPSASAFQDLWDNSDFCWGSVGTHGGVEQIELNIINVQTIGVVPIPSAVWLLGSGLIGLIGIKRKLRKG